MQNDQREKAFLERRIDKACQYVSDLWMPVNTKLLEELKVKLNSSESTTSIETLFTELKHDCSLYLYTLRELTRMLKDDGVKVESNSPLELMEQAGIERLKSVLAVEANEISRHTLSSSNNLQVARFQEIITSASSCEILCEGEQIDPELGFSLAVLRQLGFALIAWNYPGVYQQAVSSLKSGKSLDEAIATLLGYSPSLLGLRLARNWGLPPQFIAALDPAGPDPEIQMSFVTDSIASTLATICRVSETLARANNPEIYPTAQADWNEARLEIEERIGAAGVQAIQERFHENCMFYLEVAPTIFKGGMVLDPEVRISCAKEQRLLNRNPFISECSEFIKKNLIEIYEAIENGKQSKEQLDKLVHNVVPIAGFSGGCVFTIDPTLKALVPQLKIAHLAVHSGELIKANSPHDIVAKAFESVEPIIQDHFGDSEGLYTTIAGVVGFSQRIGVLYLEIPRLAYQQSPSTHLLHFKALCQTLNDCLNLY